MSIDYTPSEERWNTWSHAAGLVLGVGAGALLLSLAFRRTDGWAVVGVVLYLVGMLGSYLTSTVYHALPAASPRKRKWRHWDHAAIYWHIAGSYSPLTLVALREQGAWGWTLFFFVWSCALVGTVMSFARLKEHSHLETVCFVAMGLSVLVAFRPLVNATPPTVWGWLLAEGFFYIVGALFYSFNKRRYLHTVFHFFVLGGSLCHIVAVYHVLR